MTQLLIWNPTYDCSPRHDNSSPLLEPQACPARCLVRASPARDPAARDPRDPVERDTEKDTERVLVSARTDEQWSFERSTLSFVVCCSFRTAFLIRCLFHLLGCLDYKGKGKGKGADYKGKGKGKGADYKGKGKGAPPTRMSSLVFCLLERLPL